MINLYDASAVKTEILTLKIAIRKSREKIAEIRKQLTQNEGLKQQVTTQHSLLSGYTLKTYEEDSLLIEELITQQKDHQEKLKVIQDEIMALEKSIAADPMYHQRKTLRQHVRLSEPLSNLDHLLSRTKKTLQDLISGDIQWGLEGALGPVNLVFAMERIVELEHTIATTIPDDLKGSALVNLLQAQTAIAKLLKHCRKDISGFSATIDYSIAKDMLDSSKEKPLKRERQAVKALIEANNQIIDKLKKLVSIDPTDQETRLLELQKLKDTYECQFANDRNKFQCAHDRLDKFKAIFSSSIPDDKSTTVLTQTVVDEKISVLLFEMAEMSSSIASLNQEIMNIEQKNSNHCNWYPKNIKNSSASINKSPPSSF